MSTLSASRIYLRNARWGASSRPWLVRPSQQHLSSSASGSLIGFSPMSPSTPFATFSGKTIPGEQDARIGGVWSATSAKRDKLIELKGELVAGQLSLDDAATPEQTLDLFLADGMHVIAKASDLLESSNLALVDLQEWMDGQAKELPEDLNEIQWESFLTSISQETESILIGLPKALYLKDIRDILEPKEVKEEDGDILAFSIASHTQTMEQCLLRYRLELVLEAATYLKKAWPDLTKVSDADLDRAATQGTTLIPQATTLSRDKIVMVLKAFTTGTCSTRVDALWNLSDRDGDGLLDQVEMERVCHLAIVPVQSSLKRFFLEAIEAYPVRVPLAASEMTEVLETPIGWRARRKEGKVKKTLFKIFQKTINKHFDDEIEMPQRLRCIYAWAEKTHQENKIDNVIIDTGLGGRKRYVELAPKISLPEFREVQCIHFTHLDRIGEEYIKSFRDDLHVSQGKGRQRNELYQQAGAFFTAVTIIDMIIGYL